MSCRSNLWRIAAIWLSCEVLGVVPALAGECGFYGCGDGYVVQQTGGYAAGLTGTVTATAAVNGRSRSVLSGSLTRFAPCPLRPSL